MALYECQVFRSKNIKVGKRQSRSIPDPKNAEFLVAHLYSMLEAMREKPKPGMNLVVYKPGTYTKVAEVTI